MLENKLTTLERTSEFLAHQEESPIHLTRRGFIAGIPFAILAATSHAASEDSKPKINVNYPTKTNGKDRRYPEIFNYRGSRQDFENNVRYLHRIGGTPGIRYYVDSSTEEVAAAKGVVSGWDTRMGLRISIFHGLGWFTSYSSIQNRFVQPGDEVPRGAIIASGGRYAEGTPHMFMHFVTYGPIFTPHLKDIRSHSMDYRYPWDFPVNSEQFAVDGSGKLPYLAAEDAVFDASFWQKHLEASKFADVILKEIGTGEAKSILTRSKFEAQLGIDHQVDKRLLHIYESLVNGKLPFSLNDRENIRGKIEGYMGTVPRLSAPIKDKTSPELYKIIRLSRL